MAWLPRRLAVWEHSSDAGAEATAGRMPAARAERPATEPTSATYDPPAAWWFPTAAVRAGPIVPEARRPGIRSLCRSQFAMSARGRVRVGPTAPTEFARRAKRRPGCGRRDESLVQARHDSQTFR